MTIEVVISAIVTGLSGLDFGLWLHAVQAPRGSRVRRRRARQALGVLLALPLLVAGTLLLEAWGVPLSTISLPVLAAIALFGIVDLFAWFVVTSAVNKLWSRFSTWLKG